VEWYNWIPRLIFGYELRATRLEMRDAESNQGEKSPQEQDKTSKGVDLTALTIESDRLATRTIGVGLLPVVVFYTFYSLVYEEHKG
jgi:hypothetical protein